jgi:predicted nucleotidyltransferase
MPARCSRGYSSGVRKMLSLEANELAIVRAIVKTHLPGREIRVFGSRATGQAKPHSDLDLVVMGDPMTDATYSALVSDFEESDLPFRVDLLAWRDAPDSLRQAIEHDALTLEL